MDEARVTVHLTQGLAASKGRTQDSEPRLKLSFLNPKSMAEVKHIGKE